MILERRNQLSSKLARCRRGSLYGLCFTASAVFLIVMIWMLWFYLGFNTIATVEPQRRAIVHYDTTTTTPLDVTPSTSVFLKKNGNISEGQTNPVPLRGNSRGEAQQGLDKGRDSSSRSSDGLPKGDFDSRDKFSTVANSSRIQDRSVDNAEHSPIKSDIIHSSNERSTPRVTPDDDRRRTFSSNVDAESITTRIIPTTASEHRAEISDRRHTEEKAVEKSKRVDDIDVERGISKRPIDRDDKRSMRDDDYHDRDRSSARKLPERDGSDKRLADETPRRRLSADDRSPDRDYSRDRRVYSRDRDDYPRRKYDDGIRDYDRPRRGDEEDIRIRETDRLSTSRERTEIVNDRDDRYRDDRYRDDRYRNRPPTDDRYRDSDDRYRSRYDEDRRSKGDDDKRVPTRDDDDRRVPTRGDDDKRVPTRDDDDRRVPTRDDDDRRAIRRGDDERDDRYRSSSDDDYRRDDRYRDRIVDDRHRDRAVDGRYRDRPVDDRYRDRAADDRYRDRDRAVDDEYRDRAVDDRYRDRTVDDRYRDRTVDDRYRDEFKDKLPRDDEYRRREDSYKDPEENRYRSRESDASLKRVEDVRPSRVDDEKYRIDTESDRSRPRRTEELNNSRRRDIDSHDISNKTSYRADIQSSGVSKRPISVSEDYRSRDSVRDRDENYRPSLVSRRDEDFRDDPSRTRNREEFDRTRSRDNPSPRNRDVVKYDDPDRRRTRVRDEKLDIDDDRHRRDPLPKSGDNRDDYKVPRSSISNGDDRALDRDRPVYLVEDKVLSKSLASKPEDAPLGRRSYLPSDDDYMRNKPRTDDDDYRPPRRRGDDPEKDQRDSRYEERRRYRPDYEGRDRDLSKGEYSIDRNRDRDRNDEYYRDYPHRDSRHDDGYSSQKDIRMRGNRTDERIRDRTIEPSRTVDIDRPLRRSTNHQSSDSFQTRTRYYDDDDEYRRPPRRVTEEDEPRKNSHDRDETRVYSSRDENRSNIRDKRYEDSTTPCLKGRNSFSKEEDGLSFRRVGDDCDDDISSRRSLSVASTSSRDHENASGRRPSSITPSSARSYDSRRSSSSRPLTPKEIIDEAYRYREDENQPRDAIYPVYDPRISNITSPEVIRPNERRGTIITARRKKRSLPKRKK